MQIYAHPIFCRRILDQMVIMVLDWNGFFPALWYRFTDRTYVDFSFILGP